MSSPDRYAHDNDRNHRHDHDASSSVHSQVTDEAKAVSPACTSAVGVDECSESVCVEDRVVPVLAHRALVIYSELILRKHAHLARSETPSKLRSVRSNFGDSAEAVSRGAVLDHLSGGKRPVPLDRASPPPPPAAIKRGRTAPRELEIKTKGTKWDEYQERVYYMCHALKERLRSLRRGSSSRGMSTCRYLGGAHCDERSCAHCLVAFYKQRTREGILALLRLLQAENAGHTQFPSLRGDDEDSEVSVDDVYCSKCGGSDSPENDILFCDRENCLRAYHARCVDPPVSAEQLDEVDEHGVPVAWFCPPCFCLSYALAHVNGCFGVKPVMTLDVELIDFLSTPAPPFPPAFAAPEYCALDAAMEMIGERDRAKAARARGKPSDAASSSSHSSGGEEAVPRRSTQKPTQKPKAVAASSSSSGASDADPPSPPSPHSPRSSHSPVVHILPPKWDAYLQRMRKLLNERTNLKYSLDTMAKPRTQSSGVDEIGTAAIHDHIRAIHRVQDKIKQVLVDVCKDHGGDLRQMDVMDPVDAGEDVDMELLVCSRCGGSDTPGNDVIVCDHVNCFRAYHQYCLDPAVDSTPDENDWQCWECATHNSCLALINEECGTDVWDVRELFVSAAGGFDDGYVSEEDEDYDPDRDRSAGSGVGSVDGDDEADDEDDDEDGDAEEARLIAALSMEAGVEAGGEVGVEVGKGGRFLRVATALKHVHAEGVESDSSESDEDFRESGSEDDLEAGRLLLARTLRQVEEESEGDESDGEPAQAGAGAEGSSASSVAPPPRRSLRSRGVADEELVALPSGSEDNDDLLSAEGGSEEGSDRSEEEVEWADTQPCEATAPAVGLDVGCDEAGIDGSTSPLDGADSAAQVSLSIDGATRLT